ncbi:MAG: GNAT family N-acetyltransferase, partial [Clostridia bacterium]|nr:GNAT family N-acetyltransferase [Clostridia bacterium]
YRRQGIGEQVLARILERLGENGVEKIFLEVRASNVAARALYSKMGFVVIGKRKGYYSGGEDAVIMEYHTP